jgi:hypothetical protein
MFGVATIKAVINMIRLHKEISFALLPKLIYMEPKNGDWVEMEFPMVPIIHLSIILTNFLGSTLLKIILFIVGLL